jgi:hypothetical protein
VRGTRSSWLILALAVSACGPSGIKVESHATFSLDTLVFYAGISDPAGLFVLDPRVDGLSVSVMGRNLDRSPYGLLMEPDDGIRAGAQLVLVAVGQRGGHAVAFGELDPPQRFIDGELVVRRVELAEMATPPFAVRATGCLHVDGGTSLGSRADHDCDGYKNIAAGGDDCDDEDPTVHPGAREVCGNGKDDNCNGMVDEDVDEDGDGFTTCTGNDCNDQDPTVHPRAPELCDGKDNDCNGQCDEHSDDDGDRYTTCGSRRNADGSCEPPSPDMIDCNDQDPTIHPGATEVCNGKDDDCNGHCDETFDADGDGYTTCGTRPDACAPPAAALIDCNDNDRFIHPGQREVCDGFDDNCDGQRAGSSEFCFSAEVVGCMVGVRPCMDATPPGFTGPCAATADPAPAGYCTAYQACATSDMHDKLGCTATMAMARILTCTVAFTPAGLCAGAQTELPAPGSATCAWTLEGTTSRDAYTLGLLDTTGMVQTTSAVCAPTFGITAFTGGGGAPGPTSAFFDIDTGGGTSARVAVLAMPISVATCPAVALECN